jgi:hypothetical protein
MADMNLDIKAVKFSDDFKKIKTLVARHFNNV